MSGAGRIRPTRAGASAEAPVKPGSTSRMPSSTAATSAPSGPTVSIEGASGYTPSSGTRPQVVFRPAIPQQAAGIRTEPPVSVPRATSASSAATATAEPLDDPPGRRRGSSGFAACSAIAWQPAVVGRPSTSMQSLTASRGPSPGASRRTIQVEFMTQLFQS